MNDFTKNIKIRFDVDKVKYREVDKLMKKLNEDLKLVDDEDVKELEELMGKFKQNGLTIDSKEAKEVLDKLTNLKRKGILNSDDLKVFKKESALEKFSEGFKGEFGDGPKIDASTIGMKSAMLLKGAFDKGWEALKTTFVESFKKLDRLIDYSRLTNQQTRENLFTYGMTASEGYGLERAMNLVGISDIEDVMWLQADQQEVFQDKLLRETERYQKLYDSGYFQKMQQFQWEMQNFQDDVEYEFMTFFIENKNIIMSALQLTADAAQAGVKLLTTLVGGLVGVQEMSAADRSAQTKELFYGKGATTNVNIDNTFNNVAKSDQTWLANAGEMTYEQLIRALQKGV